MTYENIKIHIVLDLGKATLHNVLITYSKRKSEKLGD